jgi:hypothetical protein
MQVVRDEEAALAKAWNMDGIDDPLMRAAGHDDAGQMPCGLMSADRFVKPSAHLCMLFEQFGSSRITAVVRLAATRTTAYNGLKRYPGLEALTLMVLNQHFDRSRFRRMVSMAVSSLEQDQSEWQIECQNRAREGLSRTYSRVS